MIKSAMPDKAHHRLVKTTPNPRATKKSSGEDGLLPEPEPGLPVGLAVGDAVEVEMEEAILDKLSRWWL